MANYAVVIKSTEMGTADKALSENLLTGFINVLSEADTLPSHILLYAEGVKMLGEESSSIDDFKELEAQGVQVLACGTCLDYYSLTDKIMAGKRTTMNEIVKVLSETDKVVCP